MRKSTPAKTNVKLINKKSSQGVIALAQALARQMAEQDYKKDIAA